MRLARKIEISGVISLCQLGLRMLYITSHSRNHKAYSVHYWTIPPDLHGEPFAMETWSTCMHGKLCSMSGPSPSFLS